MHERTSQLICARGQKSGLPFFFTLNVTVYFLGAPLNLVHASVIAKHLEIVSKVNKQRTIGHEIAQCSYGRAGLGHMSGSALLTATMIWAARAMWSTENSHTTSLMIPCIFRSRADGYKSTARRTSWTSRLKHLSPTL